MIGLLETRSEDQRAVSQSSRRIGGVTGPHKANFKVNAQVKAQVNAHLMRASSQGKQAFCISSPDGRFVPSFCAARFSSRL